ncbi:MAG: outer membrane beta-barrel protein [Anaerolineae bacterium]|nr:outer membrane beta-barrel protein [Gemmatimonadaceae bacterium]
MQKALFSTILASALFASTTMAQVALAPKSNTSGLFFGLNSSGSAIRGDDFSNGTESGAGLAAQIGFGFTPRFALYAEAAGASIRSDFGNYGLGQFDLGARYNFANTKRALVPYLQAALSARAASQDDVVIDDGAGGTTTGKLQVSGTGFTFGGGLEYFFTPKVALNTSLGWTVGEFSTVKFENVSVDGLNLDATSTRFNLGISWFPMLSRAK